MGALRLSTFLLYMGISMNLGLEETCVFTYIWAIFGVNVGEYPYMEHLGVENISVFYRVYVIGVFCTLPKNAFSREQ